MSTGGEHLALSEQAFANKDFGAAIEHARAALAAGLDLDVPGSERGEYWPHPQSAHAEIVLGMALLALGERDEALTHLDRAVALDKDDKRVWANRGQLRRERGELEPALADLDKALSRDAEYAYARFRRAQTLLDLRRPLEAETDLERLLATDPYDAAPFALWQTLRAQRGLPCDLAALPAPRDTSGLFRRAWQHIEHAEPERALRDLNAAYALAPQPYLLASLAHTHGLLGNLARARENAEDYLATDPSHPGMRSFLNDIIARQEKAERTPDEPE
jgi:tetratricopeptide (TPR) repeat protein